MIIFINLDLESGGAVHRLIEHAMSFKSVIKVGPTTKRKKSSATNVSTICLLCKGICSEQQIYTHKNNEMH